MQRFFLAATCAAMLLALGVTTAFAAKKFPTTPPRNPNQPIPAYSIMVGMGPQGRRILVIFRLGQGGTAQNTSYAYTLSSNAISLLSGTDQQYYPLPGVALVIKKVPGGRLDSRAIIPDARGVRTLNTRMSQGTYDVVIWLPPHANNARGRGETTLTFHIVVDSGGNIAINQKIPPAVKVATSALEDETAFKFGGSTPAWRDHAAPRRR